jgi:hypothetical protein
MAHWLHWCVPKLRVAGQKALVSNGEACPTSALAKVVHACAQAADVVIAAVAAGASAPHYFGSLRNLQPGHDTKALERWHEDMHVLALLPARPRYDRIRSWPVGRAILRVETVAEYWSKKSQQELVVWADAAAKAK